jgi:Icc protein
MRLAWLTDIHLNFVDAIRLRQFLESVKQRSDAVAVSGDIAESPDIAIYLGIMEETLQKPVYFVLGNHDFYRGSIANTRVQVADMAQRSKLLKYLTAMEVVELTPRTAIVGHDGWADGRLGDYRNTIVILSDHVLIAELAAWYSGGWLDKRGLNPDYSPDRLASSKHTKMKSWRLQEW